MNLAEKDRQRTIHTVCSFLKVEERDGGRKGKELKGGSGEGKQMTVQEREGEGDSERQKGRV